MTDQSRTNVPKQDHDAMRAAAMRPVEGEAASDVLAAGGGNELPGRERPDHPRHASPAVPASSGINEMIPGEHDSTTAMHREAGAIGGRFNGADLPANDTDPSMSESVARERAREGGKS